MEQKEWLFVKPYIISKATPKFIQNTKEDIYYCHKRGFNHIPVFGSIGNKKESQEVCNMMNKSNGA